MILLNAIFWALLSRVWLDLMVIFVVGLCAYIWWDGRRQYREMIRDLEQRRRRQ